MRRVIVGTAAVVLLQAMALAAIMPYHGPMHENERRVPFADPYILLHDGVYYAYGTSSPNGIATAVSTDLEHWVLGRGKSKEGLALHKDDSFGKKWFWAPEVYRRGDGKFIMYYSADRHCCAAVADSPLGPFKQAEKRPIFDPSQYTIDHTLFIDDDGAPWIFFVWQHGVNDIHRVRLENDWTTPLKGDEWRFVSKGEQPWECLQPCNEGPSVVKHGGKYFLFYSGNDFRETGYGVGVAVADSVQGPWRKPENNPVMQFFAGLPGVGHGAPFKDKAGQWRYVFHAHYSRDNVAPRCMYIASFDFIDTPPYVVFRPGVVECKNMFPGPIPSGHVCD